MFKKFKQVQTAKESASLWSAHLTAKSKVIRSWCDENQRRHFHDFTSKCLWSFEEILPKQNTSDKPCSWPNLRIIYFPFSKSEKEQVSCFIKRKDFMGSIWAWVNQLRLPQKDLIQKWEKIRHQNPAPRNRLHYLTNLNLGLTLAQKSLNALLHTQPHSQMFPIVPQRSHRTTPYLPLIQRSVREDHQVRDWREGCGAETEVHGVFEECQ
jgi:hypothetical protein